VQKAIGIALAIGTVGTSNKIVMPERPAQRS